MSVEFEPTRLGPRRGRFDPIAVVALLVGIGLFVAVLKPWAGVDPGVASEPSALAARPSSSAAASAAESPVAVPIPRVVQVRGTEVTDWDEIRNAVRRHESWGIRAILAAPASDGPSQRIVERWFRLPPGGTRPAVAAIDVGGVEIVALGITFPPEETPLDVRIWRLGTGTPEWVDIAALDTAPSGGAFLYVRPLAPGRPMLSGRQRQAWAPGAYRVDVLVAGRIRTVGFRIFEAGTRSPAAPTPSPAATQSPGPLIAPGDSTLPDVTIGAFLTADGVGIPLDGMEGPPLEAPEAWLNIDPGTRRAPRTFVGVAYNPTATGLGVMLPPGSVVHESSIDRLAPEPFADVVAPLERPLDGAAAEHVLFQAPNGDAWSPGVYRLSVQWADADGIHDRSWHVELRPGPIREQPRMLAAARAWARYAGDTGVVLGTVEPLVGGPRAAVIRLIPLRPEGTYPAGSGVGCGGSAIGGRPQILGFAYPEDQAVDTVAARILRPYLRRASVVLDTAFGVPGLVLAAPARAPHIGDANYEFVVGTGPAAETYVLCHGMATFDDSPPR